MQEYINEENVEQKLAFSIINHTSRNVFLTGKAGTGKTTFLKYLKQKTHKSTAIVAPTGIAAINAGGVTIHSLFGIPLVSFIPADDRVDRNIAITPSELIKHFKYNKDKRKLFAELDLLIIDEVSMLRADLLDAINLALQFTRKNREPFGGVQVLMIGDMYQLPPVVKEDHRALLSKYYKSPYFFDSKTLKENSPICIEFKKVYRQEDGEFLGLLNAIRFQEFDYIDFELLNKKYKPNFIPNEMGYITLTTHNNLANSINNMELNKIEDPFFYFEAKIDGVFKENSYPTNIQLSLKKGSQVMFIRNDSTGEKRYFNGKIAVVEIIDDSEIWVRFENKENKDSTKEDLFKLEHETWRNIQYSIDEQGKVIEEELGNFSQFPIRLAWAITIHKSQGLTFDKAIIDAGKSFTSGQVYVALSRCRTLEGIVLKSKITPHNIIQDDKINSFQQQMWNVKELEEILEREKYIYALKSAIKQLNILDLRMEFSQLRLLAIDKKIPEKEKVLELFASIDENLQKLIVVNDKFKNTMFNWLLKEDDQELKKIQWQKIENRSKQAVEYFSQELYDKIWKPFNNHLVEYKNKSKIKQYLAQVSGIEQDIKTKIKNILLTKLLEERLTYNELMFITDTKTISEKSSLSEKKEKKDTVSITLEMLKQYDNSIEKVAKERNLAISTITNHISKLIATNKISVMNFISEEAYNEIKSKIEEIGISDLKKLMISLQEKYTYDDIKFVRSDLI